MYISLGMQHSDNDTNHPPWLKTGVYSVDNKPHYIVELYVDGGGTPRHVTIYEAVGDDINTAGKAFTVEKKRTGFPKRSLLGKKASDKYPDKVRGSIVVNRPLYMSEVEEGRDTFTEHIGEGFQDRVKVDVMPKGVSGGEPTGVFITLNSITWLKVSTLLEESIIHDIHARSQVLLPHD